MANANWLSQCFMRLAVSSVEKNEFYSSERLCRFRVWVLSMQVRNSVRFSVVPLLSFTQRLQSTARVPVGSGGNWKTEARGRLVWLHRNPFILHATQFFHLSCHCPDFLSLSSVHYRRQVFRVSTTLGKGAHSRPFQKSSARKFGKAAVVTPWKF